MWGSGIKSPLLLAIESAPYLNDHSIPLPMNLEALAAKIKILDPSVAPELSDPERDYFHHYGIDFENRYPDVTHHFGHFSAGRFDLVGHYYENSLAVETCFLFHGYYDHVGLYGHMIEYCLRRNFSVVIYDLPGHGLSTGEQASINDFSEYQTVLKSALSFFEDLAPKPWHMIAQSTGAAILMDFLLTSREEVFTKKVLIAPLLYPVGWRASLWAYEVTRFFVGRIPRRFAENSNDQQFLDFVKSGDPLQARHLPLRWVGSLKQWINHFHNLVGIDSRPLIIQGRLDGTVDWQRNIPIIKQKFPNAKVLYLKEGHHHLVNDRVDIRQKMLAAIDIFFDVRDAGPRI